MFLQPALFIKLKNIFTTQHNYDTDTVKTIPCFDPIFCHNVNGMLETMSISYLFFDTHYKLFKLLTINGDNIFSKFVSFISSYIVTVIE